MSSKLVLINVETREESRVAVIKDGNLEELYVERVGGATIVGNIYMGRVMNIEPSIQAAFIDLGSGPNGFLHVSDIVPSILPKNKKTKKGGGRKGKSRQKGNRATIQQMLNKGQEIMVQVVKDSIGDKGPALTTNISLPGRYLVLMPYVHRSGVSRKIEDDEERRKLRKLLHGLVNTDEMGVIARTAGAGHTRTDLKRDLVYLQRLWKQVESRAAKEHGSKALYIESDLVIRTIRDVFTTDMTEVIFDSEEAARRAREFFKTVMPRYRERVKLYRGDEPLFHHYKVEHQIEETIRRKVPLPEGGSIVIDETEALVAIDVNSGTFKKVKDADESAFRTNMAAAVVIARQLRLRDLGGQIVIDFIDMRTDRKCRQVEKEFKAALKGDRARLKTAKISRFGMLEMTRQRMRPGIRKVTHSACKACSGLGYLKTPQSLALEALRKLRLDLSKGRKAKKVRLHTFPDVAESLLNQHRRQLLDIEETSKITIEVHSDTNRNRSDFTLDFD